MPISDPGASNTRGFTLVEMLVVLLIMGLFVGLVGAIVRPDGRGLVRVEAERLAQLLELAAAESRYTGQPLAWSADRYGYRFWRMAGDGGWSEARDSDLLRARTLPRGMVISGLRIENRPADGATRLEFAAQGAPLSFTVEISLGPAHYAVERSPVGEFQVLPDAGSPLGG